MGSDCATRNQRSNGLDPPQRLKGSKQMTKPARAHDVSKLLAKVGNVVVREHVYYRVRHTDSEPREYGRLRASIQDLNETAEKLRKVGGR